MLYPPPPSLPAQHLLDAFFGYLATKIANELGIHPEYGIKLGERSRPMPKADAGGRGRIMPENMLLQNLVNATDAIYWAKDREDLFKAVASGCSSLGFPEFLFFCHKSTKQEMVLNATLTNFHRSFLNDYEQLEWAADDFMLDLVLQTDRPLVWDTRQLRYDDVRKQSYLDFVRSGDLHSGVVIPLRSRRPTTSSALAISSAQNQPVVAGAVKAANIMANAAITKAEILGLCDDVSGDAVQSLRRFSSIQHEILSWIGEGKSNVVIATIMNINERTVRYHVSEILRKLGVATRAQAAAIRRSGRLDPES